MFEEYYIDYFDEKEFRKLERALKKYNMLAYKKLIFDVYPALKNGNFDGEKIYEYEEFIICSNCGSKEKNTINEHYFKCSKCNKRYDYIYNSQKTTEICPNCLKEIDRNYSFCPYCKHSEEIKEIISKKCTKCNSKYDKNSDFIYCTKCGNELENEFKTIKTVNAKKIDGYICSKCKNQVKENDTKCDNCNTDIMKKRTLFDQYILSLPTDDLFRKVHGEVKLIYRVYEKDKTVILETIEPEKIFLEEHNNELNSYKGVILSKDNKDKDLFKINLFNAMKK